MKNSNGKIQNSILVNLNLAGVPMTARELKNAMMEYSLEMVKSELEVLLAKDAVFHKATSGVDFYSNKHITF